MMKKIIIILLAFVSVELTAQIHSLNFYTGYTSPLNKRLLVNRISGFGGGAELRFNVYDNIKIGLSLGYDLYSIGQDDAVKQWNWKFYDTRYRGIVNSDTSADQSLNASLNPVQKMSIIPLGLTVNYEWNVYGNIFLKPYAGGGVMFYTRKLYLEENWNKYFASEDYQFDYTYRNFAQDKTGNPFYLLGGLDVEYQLTDYLRLNAGGKYLQVLELDNKYGYENFPFENSFNLKIGLTFLY